MARWANQRENRLVPFASRFDCGDRAAGRAPRDRKRTLIDDHVSGRKVCRPVCRFYFALDQLQIPGSVHAQQLFVARIARGKFAIEQSALAQKRSDHLHAIGRFRMPDAAEMVAAERVGNDERSAP
jgi:hypothetical protein